jgi:hypothetical protein
MYFTALPVSVLHFFSSSDLFFTFIVLVLGFELKASHLLSSSDF